MCKIKTLLGVTALVFATASNAAIYNFEYEFDGSSLTPATGLPNLFGTSLSVGDTVNLTYRATGADSYWDFSSVGSAGNVNLGFTYPDSCGSRSSHGTYTASINGATVLSDAYSMFGQSCIHMGPNAINFGGITQLDTFSISFVMDFSDAPNNIIGPYAPNTWWQIWELFDGSVADFVYVEDQNGSIPEPSALALVAIGLCGLGLKLRRKASA